MAARQIAEKHTDIPEILQRRRNDNKMITDAPCPSSSIRRFLNVAHTIESQSSTNSVHDWSSSLHQSPQISFGSSSRRSLNSETHTSTHPTDVGNRLFSHHTAASTNRMAANGRPAHHLLSQQKSEMDQRLHQTARSAHPVTLEYRGGSPDHTLTVPLKQTPLFSAKAHHTASSQKTSIKSSALTNVGPNIRVRTKSLSSKPTRTSSEIDKLSTADQIDLIGHTDARDTASRFKGQAELLWKECKASTIAPICFINNDGKIAAAVMHRIHHCRMPGCAANRKHVQSISKRHSLCTIERQPAKNESQGSSGNESNEFPKLGAYNCTSVFQDTSIRGSDENGESQVATQENATSTNARRFVGGQVQETCNIHHSNDLSHLHQSELSDTSTSCKGKIALDGLPQSEYLRCLSSSRNEGNQQIGVDNPSNSVENCTPAAASCISSDTIYPSEGCDNDHTTWSIEQDAIDKLHDFKSDCYAGDTSEDGTDAVTTPGISSKDAFDHPSADDGGKNLETAIQRPTRSSMAKIRQKYLALLKKQEAETVSLRRQEIMARKQAGDWMLDCHMEELVHRLAPNGEARVKVLVEAFETVIQDSDSESSQTHHLEHAEMHGERGELQLDNLHSGPSL